MLLLGHLGGLLLEPFVFTLGSTCGVSVCECLHMCIQMYVLERKRWETSERKRERGTESAKRKRGREG